MRMPLGGKLSLCTHATASACPEKYSAPAERGVPGPDFCVRVEGRPIYIEAIAPTAGDPLHADVVPQSVIPTRNARPWRRKFGTFAKRQTHSIGIGSRGKS